MFYFIFLELAGHKTQMCLYLFILWVSHRAQTTAVLMEAGFSFKRKQVKASHTDCAPATISSLQEGHAAEAEAAVKGAIRNQGEPCPRAVAR